MARQNAELIVTLVRTTLVALQQANMTGNYTVLRDLGAPSFQTANNAVKLAEIFAPIRRLNIDLSPVVLLDPQITQANLTDSKMLHIAGALATKPVPVRFELLFQPVNGLWMMDGISITPIQPDAALAPPPSPPQNQAPVAAAPKPAPPKRRAQ